MFFLQGKHKEVSTKIRTIATSHYRQSNIASNLKKSATRCGSPYLMSQASPWNGIPREGEKLGDQDRHGGDVRLLKLRP